MSAPADIAEYIEALKGSRKFGPQVVCHRVLPEKLAQTGRPHQPLSPHLQEVLARAGISRLYSHQRAALEAIASGRDVIAATPTASGKSLIYNLPVLEAVLGDQQARALYLFPLKALAQDQLRKLAQLSAAAVAKGEAGTGLAAIYDGDTSPYLRKKIRRQPPAILITNPDMLHLSLLPYHDSWSSFFAALRYVVIDEVHTYRGIFGAHMAWVLRRLQRIAHYYGASFQYIMLSATIGNPEALARALTGRAPLVISQSGAPISKKHVLFINPWDSAAYTASQLLEAGVKRGLRTIVYTKSRKMTELIAMWTKPRLGELAGKLSSYRAGFLPEERRQIESDLACGRLLGVISTSALELGIDIGDLDLCILVGYPGSIMATWQRSGRVGRAGRESAVILVGGEDALDQHFMQDPEDFFSRNPENAAVNPLNTRIMHQHLHCAAAERPLMAGEQLVAACRVTRQQLGQLEEQAVLYRDSSGDSWYASRKLPQRLVDLRGGGSQLSVIQRESGEIIGEMDAGRALKEAHEGAIYLHRSETLLVERLDLLAREIVVSTVRPSYFTRPIVAKHTEVLEQYGAKEVFGCRACWGRLKVTEQVTGYHKINNSTMKNIATLPLELPEQTIETEGFWLELREEHRQQTEGRQMHFMGAIHALEHTMIAMFPLLILCDRNDIGGISCPHHEQTGSAAVFIYDGYAGGAGLAQEAWGLVSNLLLETEKTIRLCSCETGCPSCVHSPKCGSGNRPIDKAAALFLVQLITNDVQRQQRPAAVRAELQPGSSAGLMPAVSFRSQTLPRLAHPLGLEALPGRYGVFDLETKFSALEAGGWSRAERMGMSVGVVYDSELNGYVSYLEDEAEKMVEHLCSLELIVGFNNKRFDNRVLSAYTTRQLHLLPALDLLEEINKRLGYRLSLDRLARQTLGEAKSADGLQALKWYKQGKIKEIADYCRKDVALTRQLFLYALEKGHLLFMNKAGATVRLPLAIDACIAEILAGKEQRGSGPEQWLIDPAYNAGGVLEL